LAGAAIVDAAARVKMTALSRYNVMANGWRAFCSKNRLRAQSGKCSSAILVEKSPCFDNRQLSPRNELYQP
jgi:hypothetical protein